MTRILFSGDGSSGDLLPMVLMAREFKLAGYDVCVCGSSEQSQMARDFGVRFEGYPHNYSDLYLERQRTGLHPQHPREHPAPGDAVPGRIRAALEDRAATSTC